MGDEKYGISRDEDKGKGGMRGRGSKESKDKGVSKINSVLFTGCPV